MIWACNEYNGVAVEAAQKGPAPKFLNSILIFQLLSADRKQLQFISLY